MAAQSFCIVIPNYNHGRGFDRLVENLVNTGMPILVVDDGSAHETRELLVDIAVQHDRVSLIHLERNSGKGAAVMAGFHWARDKGYTHALQIDADGQHSPEDVPEFVERSRANPDAVINGCPVYDESVPKSRQYARYLTHFWVWIETLSLSIKDSMCGFRVYPLAPVMDLVDNVKLGQRMDFDSEILVRLYWKGGVIINTPTTVIYPEGGLSNFRLWRDNWLITRMHTRLFFGMLLRLPMLVRRKFRRASTRHWADMRERGNLLGMRILLWVYKHLGRLPFLVVLHPVILYFCLFDSGARKASRQYLLQLAAYEGKPAKWRWQESYRHLYNFAVSMLDKIACWTGDIQRSDVVVHHPENFDAVLASGKGAVFLGSHLGNLEICRALGHKGGRFKINALVFNRHAMKFQSVLSESDPDVELNLVHVDTLGMETAITLKEKVDQGEIVIIVGDRTPVQSVGRVVYAEFLGKQAPFSQGPFILAALMECPVYLLFGIKEAGVYQIYLEHFAESLSFPRAQRQERLADKIQDYADRLSWHCRKTPLQWFNFYDFWHERQGGGSDSRDSRRKNMQPASTEQEYESTGQR